MVKSEYLIVANILLHIHLSLQYYPPHETYTCAIDFARKEVYSIIFEQIPINSSQFSQFIVQMLLKYLKFDPNEV